MSDNRDIVLRTVVDASDAKVGLDETSRAANKMAGEVALAAIKAGKAIDGIGDSSDAQAKKIENATRGIASSISRVSSSTESLAAQMAAGSKNTVEYFEALGSVRNANLEALTPAMAKLRDMASAMSVAAAAQKEFADAANFSRLHADAAKLAKDSEYVRMWEDSLVKADAAQKKLSDQNGFLNNLKSQSDAIGKTRADLLELKAAELGVAQSAAPMIAALRAQEAPLEKLGMSAKQTAFALRGVPAQFTDIFTSLAAGQAPMMVMLQQGGQLKDMFGGVGNAAKAMGGYILGMINPMTIAAATVGTLGIAYYQGSKEAENMAKAIIMTGNAAGTSVNQLRDITAAVSASSGATKGAVNEALNAIINTGGVAAGSLGKVAEAAIKMSKATGESIEDTVKRFSELSKEPVKASEKLNEQYNYLTASVYKQIKALEDQGRATEAAALAQSTFADAAKDMASRVEANLGGLESAWRGVAGAAKWAWDKMLNVGREGSINEQISALKKQLATGSFDFALTEGDIESQIASLEKKLATETATTAEKTKQNELDKSGIAWLKEGDKYLSKKQQMEAEITKTRNLGVAAGASELEINKRIAAVREKFTEKASGGKSQAVKDAESLVSLLDRLHAQDDGEFASDYVKNVQLLVKGWSVGELSLEQYNAEFALLRQQQPGHKAYLKDVIDLERERAKYAADISKETKDLIEKADAAEYENSKIGATEQQLIALTAARYDEQIALKQEKIAAIEIMEGRNSEVEAIEQQISALRRLQSAEIAKPKLREQAREWEKFSDDINRALTDALMRGFESGKSFGENFVDSLKNSLKTAALKLVVNVVTSTGGSVVNAAINAVAGTGGANGGAGTNYMGLANNASSMYSLYSAATGYNSTVNSAASLMGAGATTGASATSLAYANGVGALGGDSLGALIASNGSWGGVAVGTEAAATTGWASMLGEAATGAWVLAIPAIAGAISAAGSRKAYEFDGVAVKGDYAGSNFTGSAATKWQADGGWWQSGDEMKKWMPLTGDKDAIISAFFGGGIGAAGRTGYVNPVSGDYSKASDLANLGDLRDTPSFTGVDNSDLVASWDADYAAWQKANPISFMGGSEGTEWTGGDRPDGVAGNVWSGVGGMLGTVSMTPVLSTDPVMLAALDNAIDAIFKATQTSFKALANQFEDTDLAGKVDAFSTSINLDTNSGDIDKVLAGLASDVNAKMAQAFLPSIETLRLPEEAWQAAFNRVMVEVAGTSRILDLMGTSIKKAFGSDTNKAITAIDGLSKAFGGIDALSTSFSAYYANFYSQEEQRAQAMEDMGKSFDALNVSMPTTRDGFRAMVDGLDLATVGGQATFKAMMDLQGGFAQLVPAIEETGKALNVAASTAFSNLQAAVEAEKGRVESAYEASIKSLDAAFEATSDALNLQIDAFSVANQAIGSLADALKSAVDTLAVETDATLTIKRMAAQADLNGAMTAANSGASLVPFADTITSALDVLGKPSEQLYGSFEDYARAQGQANASVAALSKSAGAQKTVSDMMLTALEDSLTQAQDIYERQKEDMAAQLERDIGALDALVTNAKLQLDALNGINTGILSVKDAVLAMNAAIGSLKAAAAPVTSTSIPASVSSSIAAAGVNSTVPGGPTNITGQVAALYNQIAGRSADMGGLTYWTNLAQTSGGVEAIIKDFRTSLIANGEIPKFASGGYHSGGLAWVGEEGPELVNFGAPAQIYNARDSKNMTGGGNSDAEIRQLREEQRAQAAAFASFMSRFVKIVEKWDGDGMPTERAEA